jgi:lipid-A-disaccharide synthase-like uncharacterized protein
VGKGKRGLPRAGLWQAGQVTTGGDAAKNRIHPAMSELLIFYSCYALAVATTLPVDADGFMPFQSHYWLWKIIGFGGLVVFQGRWIVQWLYSEKHKESKVPPAFWWLSIVGAFLETCYFLRQQDSVGVAGYCISFVPYVRNLMLVHKKRRRDALPVPAPVVE